MGNPCLLSSPPNHDDAVSPRLKRRKLLTPPEPKPVVAQPQHQTNKLDATSEEAQQALIPGLPDHVAQICLSSIHPTTLYSVSRPWRRLLHSSPPYLALYATLSPTTPSSSKPPLTTSQDPKPVHFLSFDPIRSTWTPLPPTPPSVNFTVQHRSFLSLNLPIQSISVNGSLVVVAATDPLLQPSLSAPLIFNPITKCWTSGPPLTSPRRWCAAGASNGTVYIASGVGSNFKSDVARSVEKWRFEKKSGKNDNNNIKKSSWEKMRLLKDGRLSREAIEAVGCRGKLYMVNVKGNAVKEGFVYDTVKDEWGEMREGMLAGWRGPAAAMNEEEMYVVDERRGVLMRYEWGRDVWEKVVQLEGLKGAEQMAAGGGRVVVVNGSGEIVVVEGGVGGRWWVVETPVGFRASSVHVLPRMMV